MSISSRFQLNQQKELFPRVELAGGFRLTSFFQPAAKWIENHYPGADYLTYQYEDNRLVFAICDGVSESFKGYFSAKFLGDKMLDWLWKHGSFKNSKGNAADELQKQLEFWVQEATKTVLGLSINAQADKTTIEFMEKRRKQGSQSMFLLGEIDKDRGKAIFYWLGNISLYANKAGGDYRPENFIKVNDNRWSSLEGAIGTLQWQAYNTDEINRLTVNTDGLNDIFQPIDIAKIGINHLSNITSPRDDVTVLIIDINRSHLKIPCIGELDFQVSDNLISFNRLENNSWIRILSYYPNSTINMIKEYELGDSILDISEFKSINKNYLFFQQISSVKQPSPYKSYAQQPEPIKTTQITRVVRKPPESGIPNPPPIQYKLPTSAPVPTTVSEHSSRKPQKQFTLRSASILLAILGWTFALILFIQSEHRAQQLFAIQNDLEQAKANAEYYQRIYLLEMAPQQHRATVTPALKKTVGDSTSVTITKDPASDLSNTVTPLITQTISSTPLATPFEITGKEDLFANCTQIVIKSNNINLYLEPSIDAKITSFLITDQILQKIAISTTMVDWLPVINENNFQIGWVRKDELVNNAICQ